VMLAAAMFGSARFADFDTALLGYFLATLVAVFGVSWKASRFWRRPASAFYGRAAWAAVFERRGTRRTLSAITHDLATQRFIRRRSALRWLAHMLLSL